jgi:hypothetical protein
MDVRDFPRDRRDPFVRNRALLRQKEGARDTQAAVPLQEVDHAGVHLDFPGFELGLITQSPHFVQIEPLLTCQIGVIAFCSCQDSI